MLQEDRNREENGAIDENAPSIENRNIEKTPDGEPASAETVSTVYTPSQSGGFAYSDAKEEGADLLPTKRRRRIGIAMAATLLALCLILGVVGGAAGMMIALYQSAGQPIDNETTGGGASDTQPPETVTVYKGTEVNVVTLPKDDTLLSPSEVYAKVANSVVSISTSVQMSSAFYGGFYMTTGAGSGLVLTESGHIVTNYHVVEGADEITVTMMGGKEYRAQYLDGDEALDIALLKIEPEERIFPVVVGSSDDLLIGQEILVIGNPLGEFAGTLTDGLISSLSRTVEIDGYYRSLIQTNAAVNPGSSGGGLFDRYGRLCGIINAKESSEGVEGLGFAIPIDDVFDLFVEIIEKGYIRDRAVLNLDVKRINSANEAFYLYRNQNIGLYVTESYYGDGVDIMEGDRICAVDGLNVNYESDLHAIFSAMKPGDEVTLTIGRTVIVSNGSFATYTEQTTDIKVTLIEYVPSSSVTFN